AALCPPCTAKKALVMAMEILDGSNGTTVPFRRMTWKASFGAAVARPVEGWTGGVSMCGSGAGWTCMRTPEREGAHVGAPENQLMAGKRTQQAHGARSGPCRITLHIVLSNFIGTNCSGGLGLWQAIGKRFQLVSIGASLPASGRYDPPCGRFRLGL